MNLTTQLLVVAVLPFIHHDSQIKICQGFLYIFGGGKMNRIKISRSEEIAIIPCPISHMQSTVHRS